MKRLKLWNTVGHGLWIAPALKEKHYNEEVTAEEVLFLAEIDALAQHGICSDPRLGCFANNTTLAINEGLSTDRLRAILYSLRDRGLLEITMKRGKRYIKTSWHDAERKELNRKMAEAKRRKKLKIVR